MTTWYHEERLEAVRRAVRETGARSILDLGCGSGDFLIRLIADPQIERIAGVDLDREALVRLKDRLTRAGKESTTHVELYHASMTEPSAAYQGFECAVLVETIEHIEPENLSRLERAVFARARPRSAVITTPNAEFNPLLGVPAHRFRHPGHYFEWDRARFRKWAHGVAARNGYEVACRDIAGHHPGLGGASQMAVFRAGPGTQALPPAHWSARRICPGGYAGEELVEPAPSAPAKKRIYLDVPYEEKEDAKKLGARWDRRQKSWYVGGTTDVALFTKWLPQEGETKARAPKLAPQEEFAEALEAHGLKLKGAPQMDGKWHRVEVEGDRKGQLSGSYRGFLDGRPAGQIMNYKTGEKAGQWVATGSKLAPEELARVREEAGTRRKALEAQITATQAKVAKRAYAAYMNAAEAPADHPYLQKKQVKAHDLKMDETGNLLVPMRDAKGFLWNLQVIREDGTKRFLKGGRKTGLMHVIGDGKGPLIIAEGYATAATLSEATGRSAAVAFDAGNLALVAEALKAKEPERVLVIAADDDHAKRRNAGLTRAREAAETVKAELIVPSLTQAEKAKGLTDFNDMAQARGMDALKSELALLVTKQAPARSKSSSSVLSRDEESGISAEDLRKPLEIQLWTSF